MDDRSASRAQTARENDDSDITESAEPAPSQGGRFGGNLQTDIGTQASLERVRDPEAHLGIDKEEKIEHQQETNTNHPADKQPGGSRSDS